MDALRTPDERFADLPDFPWEPSYVDDLPPAPGLRVAVVDEGPRDAEHTFLCLHGQPTWSFLYRTMIPPFLAAGGRVVAPDLPGFGRSDKPVDDAVYTFPFHRDVLLALVDRLDLRGITLVVQDWGGLLGLTLPVEPSFRPRLRRLVVMNTGIAVGEPFGEGFDAWRAYAGSTDDLPVGGLLQRAAGVSDEVAAAYDAPFPDKRFKAGVRQFPKLVMTDPGMEGIEVSLQAREFWSQEWDGPTFMAVGAQDPVLGPEQMERLRAVIRGCPEPLVLPDAGHFVQEQAGDVVAEEALRSFG